MTRFRLSAIALAGALLFSAPLIVACQHVGQFAQSFSTGTPQQANTLGDAELMFKFMADTATVAVDSGKLSVAALQKIDAIRKTAHDNLLQLRAANARGESLNFAIFNQAFQDFLAWEKSNGLNS